MLKIIFCHFNSEFLLHAHHKVCSLEAGPVWLCVVRATVTSSSMQAHHRAGSHEGLLVSFLFLLSVHLTRLEALNQL